MTAGIGVGDIPDATDFRNERCTATVAELPEDAAVWFFSLDLGDTSGNDAGIGASFDNVVVTTTGGATTYDFEPPVVLTEPPTSKDECKQGGWQSFNNPAYSNQGDCVSDVATTGGNPPAGR